MKRIGKNSLYHIIYLFLIIIAFNLSFSQTNDSLKFKIDSSIVGIDDDLFLDVITKSEEVPLIDIKPIEKYFTNEETSILDSNDLNNESRNEKIYRYRLKARSTGSFKITGVYAELNGKTFICPELEIKVLEGSVQGQKIEDENPFVKSKRYYSHNSDQKKLVFLKSEVLKTEVYLKEAFIVNIYLYYDTLNQMEFNIYDWNLFQIRSGAEANGFWENSVDIQPIREAVIFENIPYERITLGRKILVPESTGKLIIPYYSIVLQNVFSQNNIELKTDPIEMFVQSLPDENKPSNYDGNVCDCSISSAIAQNKIYYGNVIDYTIEIKGTASPKVLSMPNINKLLDQFKIIDSDIKQNIETNEFNIYFSKSFAYKIFPNKMGIAYIPSIEYSYFNPQTKEYKTIKTEKYSITVNPPEENINIDEENIYSYRTKELEGIITEASITTTKNVDNKESSPNRFKIFLVGLLLILCPIPYIYNRYRTYKSQDENYLLKNKLNKELRTHFTKLNILLQKKDAKNFYGTMEQTFRLFLKQKAHNKENIDGDALLEFLHNSEVPSSLIQEVVGFLNYLVTVTYSPIKQSNSHIELQNDIKRLKVLLIKLEDYLKD